MGVISKTLRQFIPLPEDANGAIQRTYRSLVLVGHSLGGVLIRQAVADQMIEHDNLRSNPNPSPTQEARSVWLNGSLRLFAPALFGFDPRDFRGFFYRFLIETPTLKTFMQPALESLAVYQDLKEGSRRLAQLQKTTESLSIKYPAMPSLRGHLLFGTKDRVVYMDRYACDPVYDLEEDQDHTSVCKPTVRYLKPLEFVGYVRNSSSL